MRVSPERRRTDGITIDDVKRTFPFRRLLRTTSQTIYVGLVGGCDLPSITVRRAQSVLRFDRRPSYFSHAFLFTGRGDEILECRLVDADPSAPENNGVWSASVRRYADVRRFPNIAVIGFQCRAGTGRVQDVLAAARNPKAIRERFDLWGMVAAWQPFLFDPDRNTNPLLEYSHPGVAFVRWALEAGGIESSPGATEQFDAPEHLWASALWWRKSYADPSVAVDVSLVRFTTDRECATPSK